MGMEPFFSHLVTVLVCRENFHENENNQLVIVQQVMEVTREKNLTIVGNIGVSWQVHVIEDNGIIQVHFDPM